jgi:hypothetical protein
MTRTGAGITYRTGSEHSRYPFGQGADASDRDVWRLKEVELLERLDPGPVCFLHAQLNGTPFPILHLGLKQGLELAQIRVVALRGFLGGELGTDGGQAQRLAVLGDACRLEAHACTLHSRAEKS